MSSEPEAATVPNDKAMTDSGENPSAVPNDKAMADSAENQPSPAIQDDGKPTNETSETTEDPALENEQNVAVEPTNEQVEPTNEVSGNSTVDEDYDDEDATYDESTTARSRMSKSRNEYDDDDEGDDDTTYFSYSQRSRLTNEGIMSKTLDRVANIWGPENDEDDFSTFSPNSDQKKKPSLMQRLDKHVLTRFGCSNNSDYLPDDGETAADHSIFSKASSADKSGVKKSGVVNARDPGDPGVQLKVLDEENESVASFEQPKGARRFLCGDLAATQEKAITAKSEDVASVEEKKEETEDVKKEETKDLKDKNGNYSDNQLENPSFDDPEKQGEEPAVTMPKTALESFSANITTGISSIKETVMTKVFPKDVDDAPPSVAGDDLKMEIEGETKDPTENPVFKATDGEKTAAAENDGETGAVVDGKTEAVENEENDHEVDQTFDVAPAKSEEIPFDEVFQAPPEPEAVALPATTTTSPATSDGHRNTEDVVATRVQAPAVQSPGKKEKKKKSLVSRIFKSKKSKKKNSQQESIGGDNSQQSKHNLVKSKPQKKTNVSKDSQTLVKTDSADFDTLLSKNAVDDDWGESNAASASTPKRMRPPTTASSPLGVSDFPVQR
eukprot:scaffold26532_cov117-Cylindrotheca_fusiformis.AAC.2